MPFGNSARRQRRPNFSHSEIKTLIDCIEENPELNTNEIGEGKRYEKPEDVRVAWGNVAQKVNSVGTTVRDLKEVRDKWLDLKCRIKKKASSLNSPNNSSAVKRIPLTYLEQRILKFISPSFSIGIVGGVSSLEDFFEVEGDDAENLKEIFPVKVKKEIADDPESCDGESSVLPDFSLEDIDTTTSEADGEMQCSSVSQDKESISQELTDAGNVLPDAESLSQEQTVVSTIVENGLSEKESLVPEQSLGVLIVGNGSKGSSSESEPKKGTKRKYGASKISSTTLEEKLDILIKRKAEKNEILKDIKSVLTQFLFVQQDMLATQEEINCSLKTLLRDKNDQ